MPGVFAGLHMRYSPGLEVTMIGDRIRSLRESRAWTQAHLADASGVSLRTIQRLERFHSCSPETLLALAAALDIDVRELSGEHRHAELPAPALGLKPRRAALIGGLLAAPAVLFVALNLLRSGAGLAAPYEALADVGRRFGLVGLFDALSPVLFIGGALAAIVLTAATQLRTSVTKRDGAVMLSGIGVRADPWSAAVFLGAAAALAALGVYLMIENGAELLQRLAT